MNKIIYLEPDEEITKVIERIRKSDERGIVLVIPKGSTISQSIINLKLLKRNAEDHDKAIGLVSNDHVTQNLADQLKIAVFPKASAAEKAKLTMGYDKPIQPASVDNENDLKVHTYQKYDLSKMPVDTEDEEPTETAEEDAQSGDDADIEEENKEDKESAAEDHESDQRDDDRSKEAAMAYLQNGQEDNSSDDEDDEPTEKDETMIKTPIEPRRQYIRTQGSRKLFFALLATVLAVVIVFSYIFIPYAEASIVLNTSDLQKEAVLTISQGTRQVDITNSAIPGQLINVEKDLVQTINSTGQKDMGTPARGTITISNTISSKSIPVSPGTKVTASDGKIFTIDTGVIVPGKTPQTDISKCRIDQNLNVICDPIPGVIDAKITSSSNGDSHNLPANTKFTVAGMTATNALALSGGVTRNVLIVTDDDLANAQKAVKADALLQGKNDLANAASKASSKIFEDAISTEIVSFTTDKNVGDQADTFQATAKIKLSALGFSENDVRTVMVGLTGNGLAGNQMLVNADGSDLTYTLSKDDTETGSIKIKVDFNGKVGIKLVADDLRAKLEGKSESKALSYLRSIDGVRSVTLKFWPSFLKEMPWVKNRIKINFNYAK